MPTKNSFQKQLTKKVSRCVLLGCIAWIGLLMYGTTSMRPVGADAQYNVGLGPFLLNTLSKHETTKGLQATIRFESGLWWWLLSCAGIGLLWSLIAYYKERKRD